MTESQVGKVYKIKLLGKPMSRKRRPAEYPQVKLRELRKAIPEKVPTAHDPVNHPPHYTSHPSGVECITVTRHMSFNLGNAVKYIWRVDLKGGIEDLEKARWYINDEIERLKAKS